MSYAQVAQHHKEKLLREKQSEQTVDKAAVVQSTVSSTTTVGRVQPEKEQHKESRGKVSNFLLLFNIYRCVCSVVLYS